MAYVINVKQVEWRKTKEFQLSKISHGTRTGQSSSDKTTITQM